MTLWPFWFILAFCILCGIAAFYIATASSGRLEDESPTLDVQNHLGDDE